MTLAHAPARTADLSLGMVDWVTAKEPVAYQTACALMAERVDAIAAGNAPEVVWLLEHPPMYTAGTSARATDLLQPHRFPVHRTGRGGQLTYHGPGQRVGYVMLDVRRRFGDVRAFVATIEDWIIEALAELGVQAERRPRHIGVWVQDPGSAQPRAKIAAIGVRLRHWVSSHGFSLNVAPDLEHYAGIVPCGIEDAGVTSLAQLGRRAGFPQVDLALRTVFQRRFAPTRDAVLTTR
jgi:lipoyl(octanoyl) transferase